MTTTEIHDAGRRADLLMSRYTMLTEGNPGFHYHWHMRGWERDVADTDSVTSALVGGGDRAEDLRRLVSEDHCFQIWRLRLEHPMWWIGTRVQYTTSLLGQIISELTYGPPCGVHAGFGGGVGSHWLRNAQEAITPMTRAGQQKLAAALRRELLGRQLCMSLMGVKEIDVAQEFPESEVDNPTDGADFARAVDAAAAVHGTEWAGAFMVMLGDLDQLIWTDAAEAVADDARTVR